MGTSDMPAYLEPKDTKEMRSPYKLKPNKNGLQPRVTELSHTGTGDTDQGLKAVAYA